jgi:hypothetical protein
MTFGKWITIPSICAALVLAPASAALAGTHAKHHKAKSVKTAQTKKAASDVKAPMAASITSTVPDTKVAVKKNAAPSKKHPVAMKTTATTKKVAAAPVKTQVKHKAKHAVVAKAKQPKSAEPVKSVEAGATDAPMAMK